MNEFVQVLDLETAGLLTSRDPIFLGKLFSETSPILLRICFSNSIYDENAEDVIHQTWETFFGNLEKFEGRSRLRTFICGILFNKIREYRRGTQRTSYEQDPESIMNNVFTPEGWWKSPPVNPFRAFELTQSAAVIRECLEGLSEPQRAAFVLKEIEEEDTAEICDILSVNEAHLRVLLFRAKDKLRKCIEDPFIIMKDDK